MSNAGFQEWIGVTEIVEGSFSKARADALAGMLDLEATPHHLPPLWHWVYAQDVVRLRDLGPDGHRRRGDLLPPVDLRRRMRAGGAVQVITEPTLGDTFSKSSVVTDVTEKAGRSGPLAFVTVESTIECDGVPVIREREDLVYTDASPNNSSSQRPMVVEGKWERLVEPDPVLLFLFSSLTGNAHRIHYDHPYATEVEGYADLVVHGPLLALLMAELAREVGYGAPGVFEYRAMRHFCVGERVRILGRETDSGVALHAVDEVGMERIRAAFSPT